MTKSERSARLGVALIGLGRMGRVHLRAIRDLVPQLALAAVAEPSAAAVAEAGDLGGAAVCTSAGEAFRHPDVRACVVVTPTETHVALVAEALELGLHVFCEKPLALDPEAAHRLSALAQARRAVLQVGFWRRFSPPFVEARRILHTGAIGRPLLVRLVQWDVDSPPAAWCDPARSGGIFVDMAVHEFDELEWLLEDRIVDVTAYPLELVNEELGVVGDLDNALVFARLHAGTRAVIELSRNARYADDVRLEILGSEGAVLVETIPHARVRVGTRRGLETVWEDEQSDVFAAGIAAELAVFAAAAAGEEISVPGGLDSARATVVGEAARRAAATGTSVQV